MHKIKSQYVNFDEICVKKQLSKMRYKGYNNKIEFERIKMDKR